jgi:hypothetical protein
MAVGDGKRGTGGGRPKVDSVAPLRVVTQGVEVAIEIVERKGKQIGRIPGLKDIYITDEGRVLREGQQGWVEHADLITWLGAVGLKLSDKVSKAGLGNMVKVAIRF